ncbi:MAG: helix-turn-helix transcriptional regulator [Bryobacteraceae bacterium]|nr:helix-turn-helix transcriptional regulator [Bryobacteraceae bacterium]
MPFLGPPVTFAAMQRRMVAYIRGLMADGELTERGLARMVGVSQPHIHNVLKGARSLSPEIGDQISGVLGISLLELAESSELAGVLEDRIAADADFRVVRSAAGQISPYQRFPDLTAAERWVRVPASAVAGVERPVLTGFHADSELAPCFRGATHIMLEVNETARLAVNERCWYALRWGGSGYMRQVRREGGALVVLGQRTWQQVPIPDRIPLGDVPALAVIRARVVWCGPDPRGASWFGQAGISLPMPAAS